MGIAAVQGGVPAVHEVAPGKTEGDSPDAKGARMPDEDGRS
jgi:hypothetical protein